MHTYTHVHALTCTYTYTITHICIYAHTHEHTLYTHVHARTCTHAHTHTHTNIHHTSKGAPLSRMTHSSEVTGLEIEEDLTVLPAGSVAGKGWLPSELAVFLCPHIGGSLL